MKKLDFIIIGITFIISIVLFFVYYLLFINNFSIENSKIEIIVKNEVIDVIEFNDENNIKYVIKSSSNEDIEIYKNDILFKTIKSSSNDEIYNVIVIDGYKVKMDEASCSGKDCKGMVITNKSFLPIICTNGVVIKVINKDSTTDIIV